MSLKPAEGGRSTRRQFAIGLFVVAVVLGACMIATLAILASSPKPNPLPTQVAGSVGGAVEAVWIEHNVIAQDPEYGASLGMRVHFDFRVVNCHRLTCFERLAFVTEDYISLPDLDAKADKRLGDVAPVYRDQSYKDQVLFFPYRAFTDSQWSYPNRLIIFVQILDPDKRVTGKWSQFFEWTGQRTYDRN